MKHRFTVNIVVALILALMSFSAIADKGRSAGAGVDRAQQVNRDRSDERGKIQERTRIEMPDQDSMRDRDQDQERLKRQDPSTIREQDIYGSELMSDAELKQYRAKLGGFASQQSREKFQVQHEKKMQNRALKQGRDLVPPGQGPIYGAELMTVQERNQYREQLRLIDSGQERQEFQAQHRAKIRKRAEALGIDVQGS